MQQPASSVVIYVIKRSWHTDVGFAVHDLRQSLADVKERLPQARYLLFGFGDRHYLVNHDRGIGGMLGALWPGPGVILATGLNGTPEEAFGTGQVTRLTLTSSQLEQLQAFIRNSLATDQGHAVDLGIGPYEDSEYWASTLRYSAVHTCNTWTAEALKSAGLPIHSFAVEFSTGLWSQVLRIRQGQSPLLPSTIGAH